MKRCTWPSRRAATAWSRRASSTIRLPGFYDKVRGPSELDMHYVRRIPFDKAGWAERFAIKDFAVDLPDALREGRKQNGFIFWNHPGWKQPAAWFPDVAALYNEKLMDGVELVNGGDYYPQAFPWIEEKNLTILSNTDVHAPAPASWDNGSRTVTLVFARTPDLEGIREALFARRTAAWMGGELWGNEAQLRGLWDGAVAVGLPAAVPGGGDAVARAAVHLDGALGHRLERVGDLAEERAVGVRAVLPQPAGGHARQEFDALFDRRVGPDVELAVADRIDDLRLEHEVAHVVARDEHALVAGEAARLADGVEALDLLVDATDRLDLAELVDGARDGDALPQRHVGDRREERVQLGR